MRLVTEGRASETRPVEAVLEVGNVNEQIEVTAAAQLLETETTSSGALVEGSITVHAYCGKDVIVETKSRGRATARRSSDANAQGLRRIDNGTGGVVVEEENNVITISTGAGTRVYVPISARHPSAQSSERDACASAR